MTKKILLSFLSVALLSSCSEEAPQKAAKEQKEKKVPKIQKHVIDVAEEGFSVEEILKIDKEIPVIEIIIPTNWTQTEYDKLSGIELLSEVTFKGNDLSNKDLDFITKKRTVKILRFKNCKLNDELLKVLRRTVVEKIIFEKSELTDLIIQDLTKAPRLKEIYADNKLEALKTALPKIEVKSL